MKTSIIALLLLVTSAAHGMTYDNSKAFDRAIQAKDSKAAIVAILTGNNTPTIKACELKIIIKMSKHIDNDDYVINESHLNTICAYMN